MTGYYSTFEKLSLPYFNPKLEVNSCIHTFIEDY